MCTTLGTHRGQKAFPSLARVVDINDIPSYFLQLALFSQRSVRRGWPRGWVLVRRRSFHRPSFHHLACSIITIIPDVLIHKRPLTGSCNPAVRATRCMYPRPVGTRLVEFVLRSHPGHPTVAYGSKSSFPCDWVSITHSQCVVGYSRVLLGIHSPSVM